MAAVRRTALHAELARIVKRVREERGLLQEQVAEKIRRPQSYVSKIEAAERRVDVVDLFLLAAGLGVTVGEIVAEAERFVEANPEGWDRPPK